MRNAQLVTHVLVLLLKLLALLELMRLKVMQSAIHVLMVTVVLILPHHQFNVSILNILCQVFQLASYALQVMNALVL